MLVGRYPALLDANVLHPAFVRGALLWFADERLFQPHWSSLILAEWRKSLADRFADMTEEDLDQKQAVLEAAFPDAMITGHEALAESLKLPDPNDQHVLAAAIVGRCHGIVTSNKKHFPPAVAEQFRIDIIHPDEFIVNVIDLHQDRALAACRRHREAMSQSKPTPEEYLKHFEQRGLIQARQRLAPHVDLL